MSENAKMPAIDPAVAGLPMNVAANRRRLRFFWPKFWRVVGAIPFSEELAAAYFCARDPLTPGRAKAVLLAAVAYFVVPTDVIPDVVAALGFTDDATVLATAIGIVGAYIKPRHTRAARSLLGLPLKREGEAD